MEKKIAALGLDFEQSEIAAALEGMTGIRVEFLSQADLKNSEKRLQMLEFIKNHAEAVMVKDISWAEELEELFLRLAGEAPSICVIPLGSEAIARGFGNIDAESVQRINRYFIFGGRQNVIHALCYIRDKYLGKTDGKDIPEPEAMPFDGIFHPAAPCVFYSLKDYLNWFANYIALKRGIPGRCRLNPSSGFEETVALKQGEDSCRDGGFSRIGLLVHRSSWITGNLAVENRLIGEFEKRNICVIPVFNYGSQEPELDTKDFDGIVRGYFSLEGEAAVDALVNLQIFALSKDAAAANLFEYTVEKLKSLNVPVFRPLISFTNSIEAWQEGMEGLVQEISWAFTVPEMEGMIEPLILGCRDKRGKSEPIPERIARFASRVEKWMKIRHKPNKEKKLAIFLHNAPCAGVEATIGAGVGLNTFSSVIRLLNRLEKEGWNIENIPASGKELHQLVMVKKAYSDFRWTSVEDIVDSGGCIYAMPLEGEGGYDGYYQRLERSCRDKMEETWGPPPGEGMVFENKLIVTGIGFGNAVVMVQPKRGCYGAKCTGEVCKILQDPLCPPPHQYFATYKYAEEVFKADAVLHVGTHGSLEFLPGKTNAMSGSCYPDAVLGSLPNLYIYNTGVGTEAILAKRRSHAVLLGHLPPVYSPVGTAAMQLAGLIGEYLEAVYIKSSQADELEKQVRQCMESVKGALEIVDKEASFYEGIVRLRSVLVQAIVKPLNEKLHEFGTSPEPGAAVWFIKEILLSEDEINARLRGAFEDETRFHSFMADFIRQAISGEEKGDRIARRLHAFAADEENSSLFESLAEDIREINSGLEKTGNELGNLVSALNGGYVPPGPAGMPDENGRKLLPSGRNLYLMEIDRIPTQAAYKVGSKAAEDLVAKYLEDEGRLPEKIAMNMISLDISRSKGEQLSQILHLMGITPLWDSKGRVCGLAAIPADTLGRPRIDVTVRISGVLRDCYPEAVEMIDEAVILAANLPEDGDINYVRKNTVRLAASLAEAGITDEIERRAAIRVFGDRPGTYGAGVDLALKASAWKDEADLARTFIYFSSFAYGKSLKGDAAVHEFVENVKDTDASYDTTNSRRYDILASNFGASVQGGFGLVRKVLRGKSMRQYHGSGDRPGQVRVQGVDEKLKETLEETLLNPLWRENVKEKGYEGGAMLMQRMQNTFEWQCLTGQLEDTMLDRVVSECVNDEGIQQWFKENNPYALEEAARRFLELHQRGKWKPSPEVLEKLRASYLKIEGDMEDGLGEVKGDIQAGSIEILSDSDVKEWKEKLKEVDKLFEGRNQSN